MKAKLLIKRRIVLRDNAFCELVAWEVPQPLKGSPHNIKYRFAYVVNGDCLLRYDNEAGKGDHKHIGTTEVAYIFKSFNALIADFMREMKGMDNGDSDSQD